MDPELEKENNNKKTGSGSSFSVSLGPSGIHFLSQQYAFLFVGAEKGKDHEFLIVKDLWNKKARDISYGSLSFIHSSYILLSKS